MSLRRLTKKPHLAVALESVAPQSPYLDSDENTDTIERDLIALEQYLDVLVVSTESPELSSLLLGPEISAESFTDKAKSFAKKILETIRTMWEMLVKFTQSTWKTLTSGFEQLSKDIESQGDSVEIVPEALEALKRVSFTTPEHDLPDSSVSTERRAEASLSAIESSVRVLQKAHARYYGHAYARIDYAKEKQRLNAIGRKIIQLTDPEALNGEGLDYLSELTRYVLLLKDFNPSKALTDEFHAAMKSIQSLVTQLPSSGDVSPELRDGIYANAKRILAMVRSGAISAPLKPHFDLRSDGAFKVDTKDLTRHLGSLISSVSEENERVARIDDAIRKMITRSADPSTVELAPWWRVPLFIERDLVTSYQKYVMAGQQYLREVFIFRKKYAAKKPA